jgi:hypothetical protein
MSICHDKQLILVHVPKTGGQSIHDALGIGKEKSDLYGFHDGKEWSHFTAAQILDEVGPETFNSYLKIAVVRNPFDRLVSEYHFKKHGRDTRFIPINRGGINIPFDWFIEELELSFDLVREYPQRVTNHFYPQVDFIYDNDKLMVDKVFRFEDFDKVAKFVKENYGVDVPHINKSDHEEYQTYYDKNTKRIVERLYHEDFEKLGY